MNVTQSRNFLLTSPQNLLCIHEFRWLLPVKIQPHFLEILILNMGGSVKKRVDYPENG